MTKTELRNYETIYKKDTVYKKMMLVPNSLQPQGL